MRVLLIATKPRPDNMEFHIIETLKRMGHEVFEFDIQTIFNVNSKIDKYTQFIARTLLREPERIHEKKLVDFTKSISPDLVLVLLGNLTSPKTIKILKNSISAPIVCWCQDALSNIGRQYMIGSPYDQVFVKDHYMVNLFNDMIGKRFSYLPEACNPAMHFYEATPDSMRHMYDSDVSTTATLYYYRQAILKPINENHKLRLWGNRPDWLEYELGSAHTGRYVVDREKRFAFSSAKIVLNTLHYAEIDGVNCRFFEIAGCGGFQLVSHKSEVSRHFEIDKEVVTFDNSDDLMDKIKYYLGEPEKRKSIAEAGMKKAHASHTYEHRLNTMLETVNKL